MERAEEAEAYVSARDSGHVSLAVLNVLLVLTHIPSLQHLPFQMGASTLAALLAAVGLIAVAELRHGAAVGA